MPYLPTVNVSRTLPPRRASTKRDLAVSQVPEDIHWSREAILFSNISRAESRARSLRCQSEPGALGRHSKEPLSQLFQPLIPVLARLGEYALH